MTLPGRAGARGPIATLAGCGVLLLACELFFVAVVPRTSVRLRLTSAGLASHFVIWRWVRSLGLPHPQGRGLLAAIVVAAALAFGAYVVALLVTRPPLVSRRLLATVVGSAVLMTAFAALALPNFDPDVYTYIATGRVAAVHHRDPYALSTDRFHTDPFLRFELPQYTHHPDIKLPAWMPINAALARVAGSVPTRALLVYRGALAAFGIANLVLVLLIVRRLRPRRLVSAAIGWGWNPIVVLYEPSKVDTVMVFFLLASILALVHAHKRIGVLLLTLATFVKLLTAPFLVLLLLQDLRDRKWRSVALSTVLVLATIAVLYVPYHDPLHLLRVHLALTATAGAGGAPARHGSLRVLLLAFGACGIAALGLRSAGRERAAMLQLWAWVGLLLGVVVAGTQFTWYLLAFVAVAVVAGRLRIVLGLALLELLSFIAFERHGNSTAAHPLPRLSPLPTSQSILASSLVALAAAGLAGVWRGRVRRRATSAVGSAGG